jgi:hypothetical protein
MLNTPKETTDRHKTDRHKTDMPYMSPVIILG